MFDLHTLALALGLAGFTCFIWPILRRLGGQREPPERSGLKSPLWWLGFLLTIAAIFLQRLASQQIAG